MSQAIPKNIYPFGSTQKFLYDIGGANPITVDLNEDNFYIAEGESGTMKLIRYSRFNADTENPDVKKTAMKKRVITGQVGSTSQEFRWKLGNLTKKQFKGLKGIAQRSGREWDIVTVGNTSRRIIRPVILRDLMYVMEEPAPRTRPKVGTYVDSDPAPGIDYYWAIFTIHLEMENDAERWGCAGDIFSLNMSAIELEPLPIAGNDI